MDNSIHDALRVINESGLSDQEKHQCRHFLKRNRNEAPFIIDAKNRSINDETVLADFLRQMTIEESKTNEMGYGGKSNYGNEYDDSNYNKPITSTTTSNNQRPDLRRGTSVDSYQQQQQEQGEVNIFKNDNELNPMMTFESGVDWTVVKHNLKLHSGWLKKKGDTTNRRVKAPFQGGDYSLIDMVPESKNISISYSSVFSFWDSTQKVKLKYGDTQDEVRKRIQHAFKFERRHFSLYHLREKGTKNYVNMDFDDLDDSKQYELVIPWLAKLQRHTKDESTPTTSSSSKTKQTNTTKTNDQITSTTKDNSTTKDKDNITTAPSTSSPSLSSSTLPQSTSSTSQSTGLTNNNPTDISGSSSGLDTSTSTNNPNFDSSSTLNNSTYTQ